MKKAFRKEALERRAAIPAEVRKEKSEAIRQRVLALPELKTAGTITLYVDFRNEVETRLLIQDLLELGKTVALPVVDFSTKSLVFIAVAHLDALIQSDKGIWEPSLEAGPEVPYRQIDLILAPGAAFDRQGYRMGYGGGFYDRLLAERRPDTKAIALAFSEQLVDSLPTEAHDQKLDGVVTEAEVLRW